MTDHNRIFDIASDEALVNMIRKARVRLVVIAPALTKPVADALSRRLDDLGQLSVTVILDADPEVYRLGFGDVQALDTIRAASHKNLFDLREQPGIRIGVVISDATTMIYSPISQNIEAGSTATKKPNGIVLTGAASDQIASAAGTNASESAVEREIGNTDLSSTSVDEMLSNLKSNPPKPFDITRKMNIFTSKVQYVEFSVSNYQLTTRQIPLPPELVDVADDDLKNRITSRIRAPFDGIGKLEIKLDVDGKSETIQVDDLWLKKERKRIEDEYTYQINNFGRVILYSDRQAFDKAVRRFQTVIEKYQAALREKLSVSSAAFEKRIVEEFLPKWEQKTPLYFSESRWPIEPTPENKRGELKRLAQYIFENAVKFEKPKVKALYKNVAPENIEDAAFVDALKDIMKRRRVRWEIIASLFESGEAAPETGAFTDR